MLAWADKRSSVRGERLVPCCSRQGRSSLRTTLPIAWGQRVDTRGTRRGPLVRHQFVGDPRGELGQIDVGGGLDVGGHSIGPIRRMACPHRQFDDRGVDPARVRDYRGYTLEPAALVDLMIAPWPTSTMLT